MTIEYHCPVCRGTTFLSNDQEGSLATCSRCQLKFVAPAPGSAVSVESSGAVFDSTATEVMDSSGPDPDSGFFEPPDFAKPFDPFQGEVPGFDQKTGFKTSSGTFTPMRKSVKEPEGSPFRPIEPLAQPSSPRSSNPFACPVPESNPEHFESLEMTPSFGIALPKKKNQTRPQTNKDQEYKRPVTSLEEIGQNSGHAAEASNPFAAPVPEPRKQEVKAKQVTQRLRKQEIPNPFVAPVPETDRAETPASFSPAVKPEPTQKPAQDKEYSLLVVDGLTEQIFKFRQGSSYVIGRDVAAGIKIMSKSVSRRHARIETTGPTPVLIDLGSANGTIVNGTRVPRIVLRDGDLIKVGQVILRFQNET
jgi:hypothetical protein